MIGKIFIIWAVITSICLPVVQACWTAVDPGGYADGCPVIVSGTIFQIEEPAGESDAIAWIQIARVEKNLLSDEPGIKKGGMVKVRMVSNRKPVQTSTDLRYEVGTPGLWLIVVGKAGDLRIDQHPVQRQPQPKEGTKISFPRERLEDIVRTADDPIRSSLRRFTKLEWLRKCAEPERKKTSFGK